MVTAFQTDFSPYHENKALRGPNQRPGVSFSNKKNDLGRDLSKSLRFSVPATLVACLMLTFQKIYWYKICDYVISVRSVRVTVNSAKVGRPSGFWNEKQRINLC